MDADEDEFGDLYTDALPKPSASLNLFDAPPHHPTPYSPPRVSESPISIPTSSIAPSAVVVSASAAAEDDELDISIFNDADGDDVPAIPGVSVAAAPIPAPKAADDWDDSDDSEDDLQIVLNDSRAGPMGAPAIGDEDDDDEDLVIVADGDPLIPGMDEPDRVAPAAEAGPGAVEGVDAPKGAAGGAGAAVAGARIGYSGHGYHLHHSQFKYVRPGASVVPGGSVVGSGPTSQIRPPVPMGSVAGRGRGDWRPIGINKSVPSAQKNFHSGFGIPVWASNSVGRVFGNGMEFTLPSHKTVFDIDIDSFEEKPWKYPGVDISDYFNFGMDEESWKDYCKQLGQLRLEATMQSKILVYESGRSEQDYDPDLPPELAAAAGIQDVTAENAHLVKTDNGQTDITGQGRGFIRTRPQLPTGRAIQVEGGYGERLPTIDTRPPRVRDSDAIIEIVLQDTVDDSVTANGALEQPENNSSQVDLEGGDHAYEKGDREPDDPHCYDQFPQTYDDKKRGTAPSASPADNGTPEGDGILPLPSDAPLPYRPKSKVQAAICSDALFSSSHGGRWPPGTGHGRYPNDDIIPHQSPSNSSGVHLKEKSRTSSENRLSLEAKSPVVVEAVKEGSMELKNDMHDEDDEDDDDDLAADHIEGEDVASDVGEDSSLHHSVKKQKLSSLVEQTGVQDIGNSDDLRPTHSDNSNAKSGSSKEFQKRRDVGEEVLQDARSRRRGEGRGHHDEDEYSSRRRDDHSQDSRDFDRNPVVAKGREELYHGHSQREWDSSSASYSRSKTEVVERPKERDSSVGYPHRRDEETHVRRAKDDEMRRREHVEETGSRHRSKLRESERIDRDEHLHSRRRVDGDGRSRLDRDVGHRQRVRDDSLASRHDYMDDPHVRRRKDDEFRREHVNKEDTLQGYRAREDSSRRKWDRNDNVDHRREDQARVRDKADDYHSVRHRDERPREREDRPREREEHSRRRQSHEDMHANRDREEGCGSVRSGRVLEDKQWAGKVRAKDESKGFASDKDYEHKDKRRQSEQAKKRDRAGEETSSRQRLRDEAYVHENHFKEDRNARHERSRALNDCSMHSPDGQWMSKEKQRENTRRGKGAEGTDQNSQVSGRHKQDDGNSIQSEKVFVDGTSEQESCTAGPIDSLDRCRPRSSSGSLSNKVHHQSQQQQLEASQLQASRKYGDADSDNDRQQNSRRGRSKLERWTSHKERDNIGDAQSPTSSKGRDPDRSLINRQLDDLTKKSGKDDIDNHSTGEVANHLEAKDVHMVTESDEHHVTSERAGDERHMDTVAKLKKRSERFKLPLPSEKDTATYRKGESDSLTTHSETTATDTEIKQERPARKRRWISS